jgi:ankyrin repeat protein
MEMIKTVVTAATLSFFMLISGGAFAALNSDDQVAFTDALGTGNMKVVKKFIIKEGVNVNDTYFAWSALQIAANKGQLAPIKLLLEKGAAIDYKHPITKMTALHMAALGGYQDVVKYLLSKGADPQLKMRGGVSIVRAVRDSGDTQMLDLLLAAGAKDDGCQDVCN